MALAQRTDIIFLDEPTTYLDICHQLEILNLVKSSTKKKVALLSWFYMTLIKPYASQIISLR